MTKFSADSTKLRLDKIEANPSDIIRDMAVAANADGVLDRTVVTDAVKDFSSVINRELTGPERATYLAKLGAAEPLLLAAAKVQAQNLVHDVENHLFTGVDALSRLNIGVPDPTIAQIQAQAAKLGNFLVASQSLGATVDPMLHVEISKAERELIALAAARPGGGGGTTIPPVVPPIGAGGGGPGPSGPGPITAQEIDTLCSKIDEKHEPYYMFDYDRQKAESTKPLLCDGQIRTKYDEIIARLDLGLADPTLSAYHPQITADKTTLQAAYDKIKDTAARTKYHDALNLVEKHNVSTTGGDPYKILDIAEPKFPFLPGKDKDAAISAFQADVAMKANAIRNELDALLTGSPAYPHLKDQIDILKQKVKAAETILETEKGRKKYHADLNAAQAAAQAQAANTNTTTGGAPATPAPATPAATGPWADISKAIFGGPKGRFSQALLGIAGGVGLSAFLGAPVLGAVAAGYAIYRGLNYLVNEVPAFSNVARMIFGGPKGVFRSLLMGAAGGLGITTAGFLAVAGPTGAVAGVTGWGALFVGAPAIGLAIGTGYLLYRGINALYNR